MTQINRLSNREWEVVELLLQGKSNKLIASSLGITERTVEFHLKNIYVKFQVSSRIELILNLGNATGKFEIEKLRDSTVDKLGERAENRDKLHLRMDWATFFKNTGSIIGQELNMKNLLNSRHVRTGVVTAIATGVLWVTVLVYNRSLSFTDLKIWALPLIFVLATIGLSVGLIGKRNDSKLRRVLFSVLLGTGVSPFMIIPLMIIIVLPLGKLAEWLGLIDPSTMSSGVATMLTAAIMIALWLTVGIAIGITLLFVTIEKPRQAGIPKHASEPGL